MYIVIDDKKNDKIYPYCDSSDQVCVLIDIAAICTHHSVIVHVCKSIYSCTSQILRTVVFILTHNTIYKQIF